MTLPGSSCSALALCCRFGLGVVDVDDDITAQSQYHFGNLVEAGETRCRLYAGYALLIHSQQTADFRLAEIA